MRLPIPPRTGSGSTPIPLLRRLVRTEQQWHTDSFRCRFLPLSAKTYS